LNLVNEERDFTEVGEIKNAYFIGDPISYLENVGWRNDAQIHLREVCPIALWLSSRHYLS
jgi:hypothetical protein